MIPSTWILFIFKSIFLNNSLQYFPCSRGNVEKWFSRFSTSKSQVTTKKIGPPNPPSYKVRKGCCISPEPDCDPNLSAYDLEQCESYTLCKLKIKHALSLSDPITYIGPSATPIKANSHVCWVGLTVIIQKTKRSLEKDLYVGLSLSM